MKIINAKGLTRFANSGGPPEKEGFLLKRGDVNKGFQKRWFVLKGNMLFYYEKRGDKEPAGVVILEGCTIELSECEDVDNYAFQISFPGSATRTYILSAESQEEMENWMKALSCAPYDYVKLIVAELQNQLQEVSASGNAMLIQAAERESRILGRAYSEEIKVSRPRRPPRAQSDRVNPFGNCNDLGADDCCDAFRERGSSFGSCVATWQKLGLLNFHDMHNEIRRQIKELNTGLNIIKESAEESPQS